MDARCRGLVRRGVSPESQAIFDLRRLLILWEYTDEIDKPIYFSTFDGSLSYLGDIARFKKTRAALSNIEFEAFDIPDEVFDIQLTE